MTLQTIPGGGVVCLPSRRTLTSNGAYLLTGNSSSTLDAADEAFAQFFPLTKAGTLSKIHFCTYGYTAGPETVTVRLESINTSGGHGDPSGSLFKTGAEGTVSVGAANTWYSVSLNSGSGITISDSDIGTPVAVVVVMPNPLVNSGNFQIAYGASREYYLTELAYSTYRNLKTAGAWGSAALASIAVKLEYSDGSFAFIPNAIIGDNASASYQGLLPNGTPDECGVKLRFPFTFRAVGCWIGGLQLKEDIRVYVREGDTTKKGWSAGYFTLREEWIYIADYKMLWPVLFETPFTIEADTWYRISVYSLSSASTNRLYYIDLATDAEWGTLGLDQDDYKWCEQTDDSGTWTDRDDRVPFMGFLADKFDDGSGGGSTTIIQRPRRVM